MFAATDIPEEKKVDRLYLEVRYSRDSCVSFPKNSDIFRLLKNYKKLDSKSFCDNLIIYFDKITFRNCVEMRDFESALENLVWVLVEKGKTSKMIFPSAFGIASLICAEGL